MIILHIVRKNTQLRASFIQNQILNHEEFKPYVVYYESRENYLDGGFSSLLRINIPVFSICESEGIIDKLRYRIFKKLGRKAKKKLMGLVDKINPDVIHLHYATDAGIFLPILKERKIPKVVSVYGYETSGFPRRFLGYGKIFLKRSTYKYANKIFAMSPDMENDLINTGCPREKVIVHYYGTDVQRFKCQHSRKVIDKINFLIISGFTPQKGHLFLLEAFKLAYKENKCINLTIVGDGPEKGTILRFIDNQDMSEYIKIMPFVVYGSIEHIKHFTDADVFIHPSVTDVNGDKEGIPGAIVEAMAAGLPVISTYHAGIPYVITNEKSGLLVAEWDIASLKNAILKLASSYELRRKFGINGQAFANTNLDIVEKEKELENIYKSLIQQ